MSLGPFLEALVGGEHLDALQATELMHALMSGEADDVQIAAVLVALRIKGATAVELASLAQVLRETSVPLPHTCDRLVDTCGTGGGRASFNLSTAAAIVAAACGAKVAKHGNRAVTSSCGSADVLESLGFRMGLDPEQSAKLLDLTGMVFLFAPHHHPAMKAVAMARKSLGIRTVFNQLGPLANPARAHRQLIGVYDFAFARPMAEALRTLGCERALVVQGTDGLDEISPCAPTRVVELLGGDVEESMVEPSDFGMDPLPDSAIAPGSGVAENAHLLKAAVNGWDTARSDAIVPNAAATIYLAGLASDFGSAAEIARVCIRSGAAGHRLNQLIEASQSI